LGSIESIPKLRIGLPMTVQVPTITSFTPDTGGPTTTDSNVVTLVGNAAPNTTVQVYNYTTLLGTAAVNASGAWSFTTPVLGTGYFFASLTAVDVSAGVSSAPSAALNLTIDATTPPTPVMAGFSPDTGIMGDGKTTAQVVTLTGTSGRMDGFVKIYDGGTYVGDAALNFSNNTWSFQTGTLAYGSVHDFTAVFVAYSGATSASSADVNVSIVAPPSAPTIVSISPDSGVVGDGLTNATVLTLTGNATANITVDVYDGATLLGNTTANSSGVWTFTTHQFANGTHIFTATAVDGLGNPSAPSIAASMTIDAHTPATPVLLAESIGPGNVVTVTGTAEANDTIRVYDGNGALLLGTTKSNAAGDWSFVAGTLSAGSHQISATATDLAGTTSAFSPDPVVTITGSSGTPPNAPVILSASPDNGPPSNLVSTSNQLTLTGTATAGTFITVFDGTTQLGTATTNAKGVWTFTTTSPLVDGAHGFAATATDGSGAQSAQSSVVTITVQPDIAAFSPLTDQWTNPISVDGLPFFVQNANINGNAPWAITQTDPQTFRFELRPSDFWQDNGSHRTEIAQAGLNPAGTPINVAYQFMIEPGYTNNKWTVLGQFHNNDGAASPSTGDFPNFAMELTGPGGVGTGDYLGIWANFALPGQSSSTQITGGGSNWLYVSPTQITRGQYNSVQIEANFQADSTGFLEVWFNDIQIVDYHGPLGYYGNSVYWKEGIYQDISDLTRTLAVDYKNLQISNSPSAPLILTDTATGAYALLSGTAQANSTVTVYDGVTKLGTAAVSSGGLWTYEAGQLSLGTHALMATATDGAGNVSVASQVSNATITSPTTPAVTKVLSSAGSGEVTVGGTITFTLNMSTAVTVTGLPTLALNNGGTATYFSGSGTNALIFKYTVGASDSTASALAINGVNLPGAATIKDAGGNAASLVGAAVPVAGVVDTSVVQTPVFTTSSGNSNGTFTLNGTAGPNTTVIFNDGVETLGTAAVDSSGNWTFTTPTMPNNTFFGLTAIDTNSLGDASARGNGPGFGVNTTLPPSPLISGDAISGNAVTLYGSITPGFSITAVKVLDGATVLGTTSVNSDGTWSFTTGQLSNGAHSFTSESINTSGTSAVSEPLKLTVGTAAAGTASTVLSIVESPSNGDLNAGNTVTITLNLSSAVTVAGGTPTLTLNDGGTASYTGGSGTNALTFSHTVAAGQNTADLAVTAVNLGTATVKDGAGNAATLTGAVTNPAGTLQIDTTAPTVSSVATSGIGIAAGTGNLAAGSVVTLTVNLSEAVTVAGGTPTLTLNNGGTATYTGGSGTNALTFSHTVAAGQNTADLAVTAVNLGTATVKDGAGNAATLTGAVTNPAGTLQIDTAAPVLTPNNQTVTDGQSVAMTNLVSVTGNAITEYRVWFSSPQAGAPALGTLSNNGTPIAVNRSVKLSSLGGLVYTGSAAAGTDKIWVQAYNGTWSAAAELDIIDQGGTAPVITPHNQAISANQSVAMTNLVSVTGNPITEYRVWFGSPQAGAPALGTLTNNGTPIAVNQSVKLSSLSGLTYTGAATAGTDKIWVQAYNGSWSSASELDIADLGVLAPVVTANNQAVAANQSVALTNLVSATGSGITEYRVWFSSPQVGAPALGTLTNNGTPIAMNQSVKLSSLSGLTYTGAATAGTDKIWVQAYNGSWSGAVELDISDVANSAYVIGAGKTMELTGAYSGTVTFAGATGTLKIDNSASFSGTIGGQLAIGDVIDLADITAGANATISYSGNNSPGTLTVSDGTHTVHIALLGSYTLANFTASADGHGGTSVVDPPLPTSQGANATSGGMSVDWLGALDQRLALWSQQMASAFPSSGFGSGGTLTGDTSELQGTGQLSKLATPITSQQPTNSFA
jgi:large repetitive protein